MTYCLNPHCPNPPNPEGTKFCLSCGAKLTLRSRYRAVELIGQGGMGRTFLGIDEDRLNAPCAIKQFFPAIQATTALAKATELFKREAEQLLQLGEHPQIPSLYAYFEQDKRWYLVQEFIDGVNLLEELKQQGAFDEAKMRALLGDVLPILQFIHQQKVVHRDIKPENILRRRRDGKLVLVDFGVAKQGSGTQLAQSGTRAGTQGYAPMEQLRGGQAFPASDLYSLGVTCVQLLTGKMPEDLYDSMQAQWVWKAQLYKQGRAVSAQFAAVLDKMLQELVRDRFSSATEVLHALADGAIAPQTPSTAPGPNPPAPPPAQPTPKTVAQPGSFDAIAADLAEIKSQFTPGNAPPPAKPQSGKTATPSQAKSSGFDALEAELESLKSEYGESNSE